MHLMKAEYMGGFRTSLSPECTISVGTAFPVTDERVLEDLSILNEDVELPLCDVRDRKPICLDRYSSVWKNGNIIVKADLSKCLRCTECNADLQCPRDASPSEGIDRSRCMDCGLCVTSCAGKAFTCDLGTVGFPDGPDDGVPIRQRQSSRSIGMKVCDDLKGRIQEGNWSLGLFGPGRS